MNPKKGWTPNSVMAMASLTCHLTTWYQGRELLTVPTAYPSLCPSGPVMHPPAHARHHPVSPASAGELLCGFLLFMCHLDTMWGHLRRGDLNWEKYPQQTGLESEVYGVSLVHDWCGCAQHTGWYHPGAGSPRMDIEQTEQTERIKAVCSPRLLL